MTNRDKLLMLLFLLAVLAVMLACASTASMTNQEIADSVRASAAATRQAIDAMRGW